jgi:hypothetical protein
MQRSRKVAFKEGFTAAAYHRFRAEKPEMVNAAHSPAQISFLASGTFARPRG